ncbi:MAG: metallophosphoesterase, partial [Chloroflexi bacterium]|nr:metallophosphoesterase [Chloroflexota bacterium]
MRIVHLSDLHMRYHLAGESTIARRRSRSVAALLLAARDRVAALAPDLIVVTGDVLEYPSHLDETPDVHDRGRQDLLLVKEWLDSLATRYCVLPGNHDHRGLVEEVFGPSTQFDLGGHRVITFHDEEDAHHVPHRLGRERRRFEAALADAASPLQIHVQHFLLWPPYRDEYPYAYEDAEELAEAIALSGQVRLALSGHYHEGIPPQRLGHTWFATAPAFCQDPHPFWAYDLQETGLEHHR